MSDELRDFSACWYAPWFAGRTSNYIRFIRSHGGTCHLITSTSHFDYKLGLLPDAMVIDSSGGRTKRIVNALRALRTMLKRKYRFVLFDHPHSPIPTMMGIVISLFKPTIFVVSDAKPHDASHVDGAITRFLQGLFHRVCAFHLTFSAASQTLLTQTHPRKRTLVTPLVVGPPMNIEPRTADERQGFAMIGRYSEYKGFDIGLEYWARYVTENSTSDVMDLWISGLASEFPVGDRVRWRSHESYMWDDLLDALPSYKAVLMPYRNASQSGVQVVAWAAGVATIISNLDGLIELQPEILPALPLDDADRWIAAMSALADAHYATSVGEVGRLETLDRMWSTEQLEAWKQITAAAR